MNARPDPEAFQGFEPPQAAASLYFGDVMHARLRPVAHRFVYSVFSLLIDVERLAEAARMTRLFSIGRFNLLSFQPRDHGDGAPLAAHVRRLLTPAQVECDCIYLLCYPRVLGFAFNPLSVYFCYGRGGLVALVYEVRNTFGESHSYVAPIQAGEASAAGVRQTRAKLFYVSPFMDMDLRYHFRVKPPGERLGLRILETDAEGPLFAATFSGRRAPLNTRAALRAFFGLPLMTLKVVAGIHWEALKLWMKGLALRARPAPPPASSLDLTPSQPARSAT